MKKMNLQHVVGRERGAVPREDYREVRNRYRKCEKVQIDMIQSNVVTLNDSKIPH